MEIRNRNSLLVSLFEFDQIPFSRLLHNSSLSHIQNMYEFQGVEIKQNPNGQPVVAFHIGVYSDDKGVIKRIELEERRILIEVDGSSNIADAILDEIKEYFCKLAACVEENFLSPVVQSRESVIGAKMGFHANNLVHQKLLDFVNNRVVEEANMEQGNAISNFHGVMFRLDYIPTEEKLKDYRITLSRKEFSLGPRDGTSLDERIFISKAPVDTSTHIQLLEEIEAIYQ
ncbi:MAG: hypothetical protein ABIK79_09030 [Chloroflexota bacterium]